MFKYIKSVYRPGDILTLSLYYDRPLYFRIAKVTHRFVFVEAGIMLNSTFVTTQNKIHRVRRLANGQLRAGSAFGMQILTRYVPSSRTPDGNVPDAVQPSLSPASDSANASAPDGSLVFTREFPSAFL